MDRSAPNFNQLRHGLRGFLYIVRWFLKSIATARESLIYLPKLDFFAPPGTLTLMGRIRVSQNSTGHWRGGTITTGIECALGMSLL